ncbi:MAG: hypothetical protein WA440_04320 [Ignavibacteriaceae bacterium]|jgi:hypothetical protein|nr:hypothetical protein [Ignavibacterium sp.]HMN17578.1 hypothetical protein [Ignavibacteriaceae bacterium]
MLKDILRIAKKNGIVLSDNKFIYQNKEIGFSDFIFYVNKNKFKTGIEGAIINSKQILFNVDKISLDNVEKC